MIEVDKDSLTLLKYNPTSCDKPGTRRWFQSRYAEVNAILDTLVELTSYTFSKTTHRNQIVALERCLGLEISDEEGNN